MGRSGPDWTPEEVAELRRLHAMGSAWTEISACLPGRSPSACLAKANKIMLAPPGADRLANQARSRRRGLGGQFVPVDQNRDAAD